ncbi:GNAT family N-acetyltransferase [Bacillus suaedae]|uniref:GNAT family N-acetyltransferase n=1 Tax=Halalkalibacter suaedae TaxID=2822140 RepID=A0A940WZJ3_9BACI|nr:GNAT family protein [Bacillus suaedae]MBP3951591.1 GNAT family N-acetyltransferase [Bacillus suaedae]
MTQLETNRLLLQSLQLSDAARIEELASDVDVAKTTATIPHPYPKDSAGMFIEKMLEDEKKGDIAIFAVKLKESNELIGVINLKISKDHQRAELGYWIGKAYWNQGFGTEATKKLVTYGFDRLNLNKIMAAAFVHNPGSWRIMEKSGLCHEGTFKQHVIRDGNPIDVHFYGVTKDDYKAS